jgi:CheY-like chemotaxis protein
MTNRFNANRPVHAVQFYEGETFLQRAVAEQFAGPLRRGEPMVMVSRRVTFERVADRLAAGEGRCATDIASRIVFVDVDVALSAFMNGMAPDPVRYAQGVAYLLGRIRGGREDVRIWIYGETVDVLCQAGQHAAAIRLEELWNAVPVPASVSVVCGYALERFDAPSNATYLRTICRLHSHVWPAESITDAPDDRARAEEIALLQQRSRALDLMLARESPPTIATGLQVANSTIYVVDDDASVRQSLVRLLSTIDLQVRAFESAEAFLEAVDRTAIGCLILDVQLVGMTGPELQTWMAQVNWSMPVIAMSASDDAQIEAKALQLGACAFLRKPFEASTLFGAIAVAMSSGGQARNATA